MHGCASLLRRTGIRLLVRLLPLGFSETLGFGVVCGHGIVGGGAVGGAEESGGAGEGGEKAARRVLEHFGGMWGGRR